MPGQLRNHRRNTLFSIACCKIKQTFLVLIFLLFALIPSNDWNSCACITTEELRPIREGLASGDNDTIKNITDMLYDDYYASKCRMDDKGNQNACFHHIYDIIPLVGNHFYQKLGGWDIFGYLNILALSLWWKLSKFGLFLSISVNSDWILQWQCMRKYIQKHK